MSRSWRSYWTSSVSSTVYSRLFFNSKVYLIFHDKNSTVLFLVNDFEFYIVSLYIQTIHDSGWQNPFQWGSWCVIQSIDWMKILSTQRGKTYFIQWNLFDQNRNAMITPCLAYHKLLPIQISFTSVLYVNILENNHFHIFPEP